MILILIFVIFVIILIDDKFGVSCLLDRHYDNPFNLVDFLGGFGLFLFQCDGDGRGAGGKSILSEESHCLPISISITA